VDINYIFGRISVVMGLKIKMKFTLANKT